MKSTICLIRHGLTEGNLKRWYYGASDIPLSSEGIEEMKALVASGIYPDGDGADFYTTGLIRTEQTFSLIYGDREHAVVEELREIDFGKFEAKTHEELMEDKEYIEWISKRDDKASPPGGESEYVFRRRIESGFEELKKTHAKKVLAMRHRQEQARSIVVCHGGPIAAVLDYIYPNQKDSFFRWIPDPGHGYILSLTDMEVTGFDTF